MKNILSILFVLCSVTMSAQNVAVSLRSSKDVSIRSMYTASSASMQPYGTVTSSVWQHNSPSAVIRTYNSPPPPISSVGRTNPLGIRTTKSTFAAGNGNELAKRRMSAVGAQTNGNGTYWDTEKEEWLPIPGGEGGNNIGDTKNENGQWWVWNGTEWVLSPTEPPVPIGDMPYLLFVGMIVGYLLLKNHKRDYRTTK